MTKPFAYFCVKLLRHKPHLGLVRIDEKSPVSKRPALPPRLRVAGRSKSGRLTYFSDRPNSRAVGRLKKHLDPCLSVHSVGASPILYLMDNGSKIEDERTTTIKLKARSPLSPPLTLSLTP